MCCAPVTVGPPSQGHSFQPSTHGRGSGGNHGGRGGGQGGGKGKGKKKAKTNVCFNESLPYVDAPTYSNQVFINLNEAPFSSVEEIHYDQITGASLSHVTVEMLDHEMDEYNASRPYQPFSEEHHTALWVQGMTAMFTLSMQTFVSHGLLIIQITFL